MVLEYEPQDMPKSVGKGMNTGRIQDGLLEVKEYFQTNAGYYKGLISLIAGFLMRLLIVYARQLDGVLNTGLTRVII